MADKDLFPLSLAQHFDAPAEYRGAFGWICGYSADAAFLNDAAERFTRSTLGQRAHGGYVSLALILDPGHPAIGPVDVPGLAHLPIRHLPGRPFRLLHAKVAVLGFRHESGDGRWRIRLLVSTGNWTRQTLEESLDLAWSIEIESGELNSRNEDLQLRCADLKAAWSMLGSLHQLFDLRVLDASSAHGIGETAQAKNQLTEWVSQCSVQAGKTIRFIDNRHASLFQQLVPRVKTVAGESRRNYLAMGSGFFESSPQTTGGAVPNVLDAIVTRLTNESLLTKSGSIDLFVNPAGCQAVASSLEAIIDRQWTVRCASPMPQWFGPNTQRSLHAKFIFSARENESSNRCTSAWLYLGSGNLTGPGFIEAMSRDRGNLEAGVIFAPDNLQWYPQPRIDPRILVTNLLPIQWDTELSRGTSLAAGADMPEQGTPFVAPPIAWLTWLEADTGGYLEGSQVLPEDLCVLDGAGDPCTKHQKGFWWQECKPRQVRVRWQDEDQERECLIPVMDEFGRLAATDLTRLDFDEAWWALVGFPAVRDVVDGGPDDDEESIQQTSNNNSSEPIIPAYPIRQMMELVENIAAKQTGITPADWTAWCARLEQTLSQIADSPVLAYFHTLGLNPLSPLSVAAFRPSFAETADSAEGRLYEAALARINEKWGTKDLLTIGEAHNEATL